MDMLLALHVDLSEFYGSLDSDCSGSTKDADASIAILNRQVPQHGEFAVNMMFQDITITQVQDLDEFHTEFLVSLMLVFPSQPERLADRLELVPMTALIMISEHEEHGIQSIVVADRRSVVQCRDNLFVVLVSMAMSMVST